uniref:Mucin-5AC n=1 Tax=Anopheles gambiae TaxID=7165 RepID=A0A1S4HDE5_ANOGA
MCGKCSAPSRRSFCSCTRRKLSERSITVSGQSRSAMDYIGRTMNICLILFMISITGSHCQYFSNRDIILTPHQLKTHPGKVLYYRPREQVPSDEKPNATGGNGNAVPWEEVLKETVFLALNDNKTSLQQQSSGSTENAPLLANRQQKAIYNAPYIGAVDLTVPRFGDIVELAHGRLEQDATADDSYFFVQQQDGKPEEPQRNVTALWKVERIRHRDDQRGHRYELKFTVAQPSKQATTTASESTATPLEGEQEQGGAAASNSNRTYIIRDEDYPRYFGQLINSPNAIPMHRKNDQMFDRTFFDMVQSQAPPHPQPHHQFGSFAPATRFYRPAVVQQAQQTMTVGQYLLQSLLSGGEAPKYHHHHHHFVPGKMAASPAYYGGLAAATSNRIKFPDTFTGSSHSVPKFYQHIHFQRPSIAPLAPTALPGSYLFHHPKDSHAPAPSNIHHDYTKLVDLRGATTPTGHDSVEAKPTTTVKANAVQQQKPSSPSPNLIQQSFQAQKTSPKPQQFPTQQQQQQFHQQVATISTATGPQQQQQQQQTGPGQAPNAPTAQQFPPQQHLIYRPQVSPQQQQQQPILIHPHAHPQLGGPPGFFPPSHVIQSIPFYNPQGQMVVNHIPVMSNHHMFQMSPPQPIAIPVHVQLIPPPQNHLYAAQQQHQQQQQAPQQQAPLHPHQPQDGLQAIPVRIMQPIPNPVHLYSPVNPFLPPLQAQQQQSFHHHHHNPHHPIVTVTPKTTSSSSSSPTTTNYQHHQHHPHPASHGHHAGNHTQVASTAGQPSPTSQNHPHSHPHPHPHHSSHSFNAIPTVFKFTSSNAIPHPQKTTTLGGGPTSSSSPTVTAQHHRYNTPNVQLSGPSISPTPAHRHRYSTASGGATGAGGTRSSPSSSSSSSSASSPSPTSATRSSSRYTSAVGQVSGPTVSSTVANHRYAPLPTVPASPAGLREKFTAAAFQPSASESKQTTRKLESPTSKVNNNNNNNQAGVTDTVGSPSNAVSPKYESFGVENAVTPTPPAESLLSAATPTASSLSQIHHSPTASPASRTTLAGGPGAFSYSNFVDASGAVSVTAKLTSEQTSSSPHHRTSSSSSASTASLASSSYASSAGSPSPTTPISITTQATYVPPPKSYIQQLGPTIGVKYPPAFKSMPSVTIVPPQIETPIASTLKTYQYLNHHDTYDFIPSRVVELAHVKKMNGQKHGKRTKSQKGQKKPNGPMAGPAGAGMGPNGNHHHHVTVTSSKPLRFYPGDGPEYATHRPEAQLSVQLPPPEKDYTMTYYGTPKHNQKVQRPKNFVTPLHSYQSSSTTPIPPPSAVTVPSSSAPSVVSSVSSPAPASASTTSAPPQQVTAQGGRNVTVSTFRSATASSTAHYYKNRNEKSDDLTTMGITTMRPRMMLKTIYRQFPGSFVSTSTSTSTEKPVQKWVPKRPRTSSKSTSGEFSTSTLPSSSLPLSGEQAVASSERAIDVVTKTPVVPIVRSNLDQQMQRVRASRGRSRYTYRRIPSGNPPPIPTGQQQHLTGSSMRTSRMRNSNFSTSTTTIKPIPSVTSSVFDSNRIDGRSFEQQERKAEEMVMTTATAKNASNEKIKRDTSEATDDNKEETDRTTVAVAEQLVAQQAEHKQDALEVTEPEKEFVMVKANISPPIATNQSNMVLFEASDAVSFDASSGPAAVESSGRSIGSAFDDLTMSIINHAKAIVNQTEKPADPAQEELSATEPTVAPAVASGKSIESNEIAHKDEYEPETTVEVTTAAAGSTSSPVTESTVSETIGTTFEDGVEGATADDGASQTTVAVDVA